MFLQFILKDFFKLFKLGLYNDRAIRIRVLIKLIIILVIILGFVKFSERFKSCYDRVVKCTTFIQFSFIFLGFLFLFVIVIKYCTAILCAFICSLAIQSCWIMNLPENFK